MPTRHVVLTDHHERVLDALVVSGRYLNAGEILREGLRLVEEREAPDAARLSLLQEAAGIGLAELDAGQYREIQDEELEDFVASLGRRAAGRVPPATP